METQNVQTCAATLKIAEETALKRYQWIAPLTEEGLSPSERGALRRKIAEKEDISERSLFRYEKLYRDGGFKALFPNLTTKNRSNKNFPDDYDELILKIAALRLENPSRSIERCIGDLVFSIILKTYLI